MHNMSEDVSKYDPKPKVLRCLEWLQEQNDPKKLSLQNKNDIQFIIETNAHRKKFLLSTAEDDATVPGGVDEPDLEPQAVPIARLRTDKLSMECEWAQCKMFYHNYDFFQKHVISHTVHLHVINNGDNVKYVCLWDICGYDTNDFNEMVRHINYHAYHAKLLAIGFNGRATLKLERCRKDSSKRNQLPPLKCEHQCMWIECEEKFNSFQLYLDHVKYHIFYSENVCSWAGCGLKFTRRALLIMHVRSHTKEKLIACYHCGRHFSCNRKLCDHLARQNVIPESGYQCSMCGNWYATEYLVREHSRQHVSAFACALCDMSAPSRALLALHVRYRHLRDSARTHACPSCDYRAVTKADLSRHLEVHKRREKKARRDSDAEGSNEENSEEEIAKPRKTKKYACHMCPEKQMAVFSRGSRLTTHLVKVHGAQWPYGHSRFRYQISEDGMYRLTTTRFEVLEVSKKIVDGYRGPKESLDNSFEFNLTRTAEATATTPVRFEITPKISSEGEAIAQTAEDDKKPTNKQVEILMCDLDEHGNIINSKTIDDVVYM